MRDYLLYMHDIANLKHGTKTADRRSLSYGTLFEELQVDGNEIIVIYVCLNIPEILESWQDKDSSSYDCAIVRACRAIVRACRAIV